MVFMNFSGLKQTEIETYLLDLLAIYTLLYI